MRTIFGLKTQFSLNAIVVILSLGLSESTQTQKQSVRCYANIPEVKPNPEMKPLLEAHKVTDRFVI
jgi:hypothetical protein